MSYKQIMLLAIDAMVLELQLQTLAVSQLNMMSTCDRRLPNLISKAHKRFGRRIALLEDLEKKGGETNGNSEEEQSEVRKE